VPPFETTGVNDVAPEVMVPSAVVHATFTGAVADDPASVMVGDVHEMAVGAAICASGAAMFAFTAMELDPWQPLSVSVTVKVYVPAFDTTTVAVLAPDTILPLAVLHWYILLVADVAPCMVTFAVVQFIVAGKTGNVTVGFVIFCTTVTVLESVHPVIGWVAVKMYMPGWLTTGVCVVFPDTIPGPVHSKLAPAVVDKPFNVTDVAVHVKLAGFVFTVTLGKLLSAAT
jgi:hypothetical protein